MCHVVRFYIFGFFPACILVLDVISSTVPGVACFSDHQKKDIVVHTPNATYDIIPSDDPDDPHVDHDVEHNSCA